MRELDRIGQISQRDQEFLAEINVLSVQELVELRGTVEAATNSMKEQLREARIRLVTTGEYADRNWYSATEAALRHWGWRSQRIQELLGRKRRESGESQEAKSRADRSEFARRFMGVARKLCSQELYQQIMAETKAGAAGGATES